MPQKNAGNEGCDGRVIRADNGAHSSFKPRHSISGMPGVKNSPERVYRGLTTTLVFRRLQWMYRAHTDSN